MKTYRHLFFDLDHTLWDFDRNAGETLETLFDLHNLSRYGTFTVDEFVARYQDINHALWRLYQANKISQAQLRATRFVRTLTRLGVPEDEVPADISTQFTEMLPLKKAVFPHTHETLAYLQTKYELHLITNGFNDIQYLKLESSDLTKYFGQIVTSEHSGCLKPDPQMFAHALQAAGATAQESLMVGDNLECDVLGAYNAGIDQVYFNPARRGHRMQITYEISCLSELRDIL